MGVLQGCRAAVAGKSLKYRVRRPVRNSGLRGQKEAITTAAVIAWPTACTPEFREATEAWPPTLLPPTRSRHARRVVAEPTLVVHHFHLAQLANLALTKVRRRAT